MIKNKADLIRNARTEKDKRCREILVDIAEKAIHSVDPKNAIQKYVRLKTDALHVDELKLELRKLKRVFVVGGGKASGSMAQALETILGDTITAGEINILREKDKGIRDENENEMASMRDQNESFNEQINNIKEEKIRLNQIMGILKQ